MNGIRQYQFYPLPQINRHDVSQQPDSAHLNESSFDRALSDELSRTPVKLTKHAKERLIERNIHFSSKEWTQIHDKMREAGKKGVRDSLVLTKDAALLVNTEKNAVITAMNIDEATARIFTNINGTIVINH
ncbi:flagellar operon protein [Sporolactobacillus sp. THM7-7]|nr:flagellar operon protein [Sporolactobacillus sp. THM7-7]